jgi:hypothetical protein
MLAVTLRFNTCCNSLYVSMLSGWMWGQDKTVAPRTLNVNVIQSPCGVINKIRSGQTPVFILSMLEPWTGRSERGPKETDKDGGGQAAQG